MKKCVLKHILDNTISIYFHQRLKTKIIRIAMNLLTKSLLKIFSFGVVGYILSLFLIVFNKYIHHSLTHQFSNSENNSFIGIIIYITTERLTSEDFLFCLYGLIFMLVVGFLRNFERRTRAY